MSTFTEAIRRLIGGEGHERTEPTEPAFSPETMAVVELLYLEDCPSYERLLPIVRRLAGNVGAQVVLRRVETFEDAESARFLGSPTVRVDGVDVEPGAGARDDFGLKCRLYRFQGGYAALPSEQWIRAALAADGRADGAGVAVPSS